MKKSYYIFSVIASALLLAGCAKETAQNIADEQLVEYSILAKVDWPVAEAEDGTKVTLDGSTPAWENGDKILVLDADKKPVGKDGGIFTYSSGKFTGKVKVGQTPKYAIYPASAATVSGDAAVTAGTLAAPTGDDAGSIKGAVMLGSSTDGTTFTFTFTNACAVLKINTGEYGNGTNPAIKSIKVSATYGTTAAPIAGAFTINWTAAPTIAAADSDTVNELTVAPSSGNFPANQDIYIPILPLPNNSSDVAPSMAFEFTNTNGGTATVSHAFTAAITANTLKNLGTAQGLKFLAPPPSSEFWVDLGMVSDNGKKLYVSKYDVKSVENGVATFETGSTINNISLADANSITKSQDGQECRLMSFNEYLSLAIPANFEATAIGTSPNRTFTFTSKMTGLSDKYDHSINFHESWYRPMSYSGSDLPVARIVNVFNNTVSENFVTEVSQGIYPQAANLPVKLVCEVDEDIPSVVDLKIYFRYGSTYPCSIFTTTRDQDCTNKSFSQMTIDLGAMIRPVLVFDNGFQYFNYSDGTSGKYYTITCTEGGYTVSPENRGYIIDQLQNEIHYTFEVSYPSVSPVTFKYYVFS